MKETNEEEEHQIELRGLPELVEFLVKYVTGPGGDPLPHADREKGGAEDEEVLHKSEEMRVDQEAVVHNESAAEVDRGAQLVQA